MTSVFEPATFMWKYSPPAKVKNPYNFCRMFHVHFNFSSPSESPIRRKIATRFALRLKSNESLREIYLYYRSGGCFTVASTEWWQLDCANVLRRNFSIRLLLNRRSSSSYSERRPSMSCHLRDLSAKHITIALSWCYSVFCTEQNAYIQEEFTPPCINVAIRDAGNTRKARKLWD